MTIPHLRSLMKGASSYVLRGMRSSHVGRYAHRSAETHYSVFLRFLSILHEHGFSIRDATIIELGPGSSIGFGLAALLAGAKHYTGLDRIDFTDRETNLETYDRLVRLFSERTPIPKDSDDAQLFPFSSSYDFPAHCFPNDAPGLSGDRKKIAAIRNDVAIRGNQYVTMHAPWDMQSISSEERADLIVSNAVLEHVDDLEGAYTAMRRWTKEQGYTAHVIDFSGHDMFHQWNGHWACPHLLWTILRGKRHYLINRTPYSHHIRMLTQNDFQLVADDRIRRVDGLVRERFTSQFQGMSIDDAHTHMAFVICRIGH